MMRAILLAPAFACALALTCGAASAQERVWSFRDQIDPAELTFALPDSDDLHVALSCAKDSRQLVALFPAERRLAARELAGVWVDDVGRPAPWPVSVTIASGEASTTIPGQATPDPVGGGSLVKVEFSDRAPVAEAFAKTGEIRLSALGATAEPAPVPRRDLRRFMRHCR